MSKSKPLIALRLWMRHRSNRKILARLSDRTLRDIGLSRSGIDYIARIQTAKSWER